MRSLCDIAHKHARCLRQTRHARIENHVLNRIERLEIRHFASWRLSGRSAPIIPGSSTRFYPKEAEPLPHSQAIADVAYNDCKQLHTEILIVS